MCMMWSFRPSGAWCVLVFGLVQIGRVMSAAGVQQAATPPPLLFLSPSVFVSPPLRLSLYYHWTRGWWLWLCHPLSVSFPPALCDEGCQYERGEVGVVMVVEGFLSFTAPELVEFDTTEKKAQYYTCTEVSHVRSVTDMKESRWVFKERLFSRRLQMDAVATVDEVTGDFLLRSVHGASAANKHQTQQDYTINNNGDGVVCRLVDWSNQLHYSENLLFKQTQCNKVKYSLISCFSST